MVVINRPRRDGTQNQGSFPKERTLGTLRIRRRGAEGVEYGEGVSPYQENFFSINRRILVLTECFLHSSPKASLNAVLDIGEGQKLL